MRIYGVCPSELMALGHSILQEKRVVCGDITRCLLDEWPFCTSFETFPPRPLLFICELFIYLFFYNKNLWRQITSVTQPDRFVSEVGLAMKQQRYEGKKVTKNKYGGSDLIVYFPSSVNHQPRNPIFFYRTATNAEPRFCQFFFFFLHNPQINQETGGKSD